MKQRLPRKYKKKLDKMPVKQLMKLLQVSFDRAVNQGYIDDILPLSLPMSN